jgi:hypothetical protein
MNKITFVCGCGHTNHDHSIKADYITINADYPCHLCDCKKQSRSGSLLKGLQVEVKIKGETYFGILQ